MRAVVLRALLRGLWRHKRMFLDLGAVVLLPILAVVVLSGSATPLPQVLAESGAFVNSRMPQLRVLPPPPAVAVQPTPEARGGEDQPPAGAVRHMEALKNLDAEAYWATLDADARRGLMLRGTGSPAQVQAEFNRIRQAGAVILDYRYVGSARLHNGDTVTLFVAERRTPNGGAEDVTYLITTDPDGLVRKVE